jgi:hypothetical protein
MTAVTPTAMTAVAPAHFFRREAIDFITGGYGGMGILIGGQFAVFDERSRQQRRRLRARRERDAARGKSKGEFQKVPALHDISSSAFVAFLRGREFRCGEMNAC